MTATDVAKNHHEELDDPVETKPPEPSAEEREEQASKEIEKVLRKHKCRITGTVQLTPKAVGNGDQLLIDSSVRYGVQALP